MEINLLVKASNTNVVNIGINQTKINDEDVTPSRRSLDQYRGPGHLPVSARMKWNKQVTNVVMEYCYRSSPVDGIGYRRILHREWRERGLFECIKKNICDQERTIIKNRWFTEVELGTLKRNICGRKC